MKVYALWLDSSVDYECNCQTVIAVITDKEIADFWQNATPYSDATGYYEFDLDIFNAPLAEFQYNSFGRMSYQEYERAVKYNPEVLNYKTEEAVNILKMLLQDKSILPQVKDNSLMKRNYECTNCKHKFEREERMGAEARKKCPKCRHLTLVRKIEVANIHFTGTGFTRSSTK